MQTKVEGLILYKILLKEKDILCKMLLRNGKKITVMFYGGKGGGSKRKNSILELGHLVAIEIQHKRHQNGQDEIYVAKEWVLLWAHKFIRLDYPAFYLLSFYVEVLGKMSHEAHLHFDNPDDFHELGTFRVLSNAIFHLDSDLAQKKASLSNHLWFFLAKLSYELGVAPKLDVCVFCDAHLVGAGQFQFSMAEGGFVCPHCLTQKTPETEYFGTPQVSNQELIAKLRGAFSLKYSENTQIKKPSTEENRQLFSYLCYQFHLQEKDFKTLNLLIL